MIPCQ